MTRCLARERLAEPGRRVRGRYWHPVPGHGRPAPRPSSAPTRRLTVYRVAQEALTNIRKHARPSRVEILLAYEPSGIRLIVEDFGR